VREIVIDTETTGLDPATGHRIVEVGCVELDNHVRTDRVFQTYLNPEREIPPEAFAIHGLSKEFLIDHPRFEEVVDPFLDFLGDSTIIAHNAEFDIGFINSELENISYPTLTAIEVIDTVRLARQKFPGMPASLDALCRRFGIDTSSREKHGALLDAELLADVYLELLGGRQPALELTKAHPTHGINQVVKSPRPHTASASELAAHAAFMSDFDDPFWQR
tara:strand:+ start:5396 stop:6055 length:660 start_codon:yes stop_codon:yes gene_type:complete